MSKAPSADRKLRKDSSIKVPLRSASPLTLEAVHDTAPLMPVAWSVGVKAYRLDVQHETVQTLQYNLYPVRVPGHSLQLRAKDVVELLNGLVQ